jgi:hypothetical protein
MPTNWAPNGVGLARCTANRVSRRGSSPSSAYQHQRQRPRDTYAWNLTPYHNTPSCAVDGSAPPGRWMPSAQGFTWLLRKKGTGNIISSRAGQMRDPLRTRMTQQTRRVDRSGAGASNTSGSARSGWSRGAADARRRPPPVLSRLEPRPRSSDGQRVPSGHVARCSAALSSATQRRLVTVGEARRRSLRGARRVLRTQTAPAVRINP